MSARAGLDVTGDGGFMRCTPELLRAFPTVCHDQPYGDPRRRIVGQREDGTCDYHEHWIAERPSTLRRAGLNVTREARNDA